MGPISVTLTRMTDKDPQVVMENLEAVIKIIVDTVLNADQYKLKEKNARILKDWILKVNGDASGLAVLTGVVNTLDADRQAALQMFLQI